MGVSVNPGQGRQGVSVTCGEENENGASSTGGERSSFCKLEVVLSGGRSCECRTVVGCDETMSLGENTGTGEVVSDADATPSFA